MGTKLSGQGTFLSQTVWPGEKKKFEFECFEILRPQRLIVENPRYKSGIFYSDKCQRNIQYESGLELELIKKMERDPDVTFYYEQPVRINYRRGRRKATYTPDFALFLRNKQIVLMEVKDLSRMLEYRVQMRMEVLLDYCYKKGFGLLLTDGKHTVDTLKKVSLNTSLEKEILSLLQENRILRKKQNQELMQKHKSTHPELLKIVLTHHLKYQAFPFKLEADNPNKLFHSVFIKRKPYKEFKAEGYTRLFSEIKNVE